MAITQDLLDSVGAKLITQADAPGRLFAYTPSNNAIGMGGPDQVHEITDPGSLSHLATTDLSTLPTQKTGNVQQNFLYGKASGSNITAADYEKLLGQYASNTQATNSQKTAEAATLASQPKPFIGTASDFANPNLTSKINSQADNIGGQGNSSGLYQVEKSDTPRGYEVIYYPPGKTPDSSLAYPGAPAPSPSQPNWAPSATTGGEVKLYSGAAGYTGPSIVDFLKAAGQPSDLASLGKLGAQYGIVNDPSLYKGTAAQNTQLLNILKGFAQGTSSPSSISPLGIPSTVSSGAGDVPTPTTPINLNNLGGNTDISKILGANVPAGSTNSDIAGLLSLYGASTESQKSYDQLTGKLTDLMSSLGSEGADLQAEMDKQGVGAAYTQVKELNLRAAQLQGELAQFDVQTQQGKTNLEDQSIPTGLIVGQQAQYQKQQDLNKLTKTAELSATLALSQAYQGNVTLGTQLAHNAIDLKYQPIQNQLDVLKTQIGFAKDSLNREDTARSNVIDKLITLKENEITVQKDKEKQIQTLAVQAASNGAPLSVITAMQGSSDAVTAARVGNQWLKGNLEKVGGNGSSVFSQTQLNKGAANAGVPIADFSNLSDDSKNYYVNSYASFQKIINDLSTGAKNADGSPKEDAKAVTDEINASNLPQDVKDNLTGKLKQYLPATASGSGFLGGIGNFFGGIYNGIKSFF